MKKTVIISLVSVAALVVGLFSFTDRTEAALLNATGLVGQTDASGNPVYTTKAANNGYGLYARNAQGLYIPNGSSLDPVDHRLFVGDSANRRVLVFPLDANNHIASTTASYVLGARDFTSNSWVSGRRGFNDFFPNVAYDPIDKRLFVPDSRNNRIMVFNVNPETIHNGQDSDYVIGQNDFTTYSSPTGLNDWQFANQGLDDIAYDLVHSRLFVSDELNNRVLVFDVSTSTMSNGKHASYVLGASDFTHLGTLMYPTGISYDPLNDRIFVNEVSGISVQIYNVKPNQIQNGESALYVLGQYYNFSDDSSKRSTQNHLYHPDDMLGYDPATYRLFVSDSGNNRIMEFIVPPGVNLNGINASNVLGQDSWTSTTTGTTQNTFATPNSCNSFDPSNNRLFVKDRANNRVMEFSMIKITNTTLSTALVGVPYGVQITIAEYQGDSQSFSIASGTLPTGLHLNTSTGYISGTPTEATTTTFTIEADDNFSTGPFFDRATFTLTTAPAQIDSFQFTSPSVVGTIDNLNHTISLTVPYDTSVSNLTPTIQVPSGSTISPATNIARDFINPVVYTVTAADNSTQTYTVTVTVAKNPAKSITSFSFPHNAGVISGNNIAVNVPIGTDVTNLVASFTTTGSVVNAFGVPQTSGAIVNDFTYPVGYTVVAEDGTVQPYTVTVKTSDARAIEISNVTSTNGTTTITLSAQPSPAPTTVNFSATSNVNGAGENPLTLSNFNYDGDKTVTFNFTPFVQTSSQQSVVIKVTAISPYLVGSGTTIDSPLNVVVSNNYAYVLNVNGDTSTSTLQVFNISSHTDPVLVGSINTDDWLYASAVSGDYAYAADVTSKSIQVFNISAHRDPAFVGSASTAFYGIDVSVSGNYAYVLNNNPDTSSSSLQIFDISSHTDPVLIGAVPTNSILRFSPNRLSVSGDFAYVWGDDIVTGSSTIQVFNVGSHTDPVLVGSVDTALAPVEFAVLGDYLYALVTNIDVEGSPSTIQIFNISNHTDPVLVTSTSTTASSIAASGDLLYLMSSADQGASGLVEVFNVASSTNPYLVNSGTFLASADNSPPADVVVSGDYAYFLNSQSSGGPMQAMKIQNSSSGEPFIISGSGSGVTDPPTPTPTPTPTPPSSNHYSSSGGGSRADLATLIKLGLIPPIVPGCPEGYICTPNPTVNASTSATANKQLPQTTFTLDVIRSTLKRDLQIGNTGPDVKFLQQYLNSLGYIISTTGAGSPGKETNLFGGLTKKALAKFQKDHGIPATGYFGPKTRGYISK